MVPKLLFTGDSLSSGCQNLNCSQLYLFFNIEPLYLLSTKSKYEFPSVPNNLVILSHFVSHPGNLGHPRESIVIKHTTDPL